MTAPDTTREGLAKVVEDLAVEALGEHVASLESNAHELYSVCRCGEVLARWVGGGVPEIGSPFYIEGIQAERVHVAQALAAALHDHLTTALAAEREAVLGEKAADARWNTAVDWLINEVNANDFAAPFFAYVDGLITLKELRGGQVGVETINRRRERAELRAGGAS